MNIVNKCDNIVIEFNTSSFLSFEDAASSVLQEHVFAHDKDSEDNIVRKIYKKTTAGVAQYTLSLYRTTLRALVNGQGLEHFWNDLQDILAAAGFGEGGALTCPADVETEASVHKDRKSKGVNFSQVENMISGDVDSDLHSDVMSDIP